MSRLAARLRRPYAEMLLNFLVDLVAVRARWRRFRPLMTNFYVTKRCNLRCRYCHPPGSEPELPLEEALELLAKIRPGSPALNITGGEPLLYPGIAQIIERAWELRFYPILLSTNGLLIDRVEEQLQCVDHVVVSLDSLRPAVNEGLTCVPGSTDRILRGIRRCARLANEHGFDLSLHSVIAPETMDSIEEILDYCESVGATLSISPEHGTFLPHADLPANPTYEALIDRLRLLKAHGKPLFCSDGYLGAIRDFAPSRCYPFVSPRVEPDGRVYFPCQRMKKRHVYLQDYPSLLTLMQQEGEWIAEPECLGRCHLACYVEVAQYLEHPLAAAAELSMRRTLLGGARASRTGQPAA